MSAKNRAMTTQEIDFTLVSDDTKIRLILGLAKWLTDPKVSEGVLHAASVLNGKGLALRKEARAAFDETPFVVLPSSIRVAS